MDLSSATGSLHLALEPTFFRLLTGSNSPGAIGGFGAYHHLRQSLVFLNMPTVNQPETYVGGVAAMFDDNGELTDEATREFLTGFALTFADGIERHLS
jgi:chromate reductase